LILALAIAGSFQCSEITPNVCFQQAEALRLQGKEEDRPSEAVRALLQKGCTWRHGMSCWKLGEIFLDGQGVDPDHRRAARYYARGCRLFEPKACREAGKLWNWGSAFFKSKTYGKHYLRLACDLQDEEACITLNIETPR
tara:strand:+ start:275 stop:694 length:420 start_codon:yes stop_codon:yes gene_type:complete